MDFENILEKVIGDFEKEDIRYGLIGGFALGLWGVIRATADLDFLIDKKSLAKAKDIMLRYGYKCFYESENVAQYDSANNLLGEIDFLYAFRPPSLTMLNRTVKKKIFRGKITINVLIPEDLIGLKIQAIVNNQARKAVDWNDMEQLIETNLKDIDWEVIRRHFLLFNLDKDFKALRGKYV